jgi:PAS domain S-box-containing protein
MDDTGQTREELLNELTRLRKRIAGLEAAEEARREAGSALRESEERFRLFFDNLPEYCYMVSPEGAILDANKAALAILGRKKPALIGQPLSTIYAPEILPEVERLLAKWQETGRLRDEELVIVTNSGERRTVLLSVDSVTDENGNILHSVSVQKDITDRKRAEETLLVERDKAQKYLDIAGVIIVAIDRDQTVSLINQRGCQVLGCEEGEVIGKNWFDSFLPEAERDEVKAVFTRLMAGEIEPVEHFENRVLTKDGSERIIAWRNTILTDDAGDIVGTLSSGEDITGHRQAEEAIRESRAFLQSVFDSIQDGLSILDSDLTIVHVNQWMEKMYPEDLPLVGKKCYQVYQKRQSSCPWCPSIPAIETGKVHTEIVPYPSAEEPTGWIELSAFPVIDADGRVVNIIEHVKDITERKRAEDALREAHERLLTVLDSIDAHIYVADMTTYEILFMNRAMRDDFGDNLVGMICWKEFRGGSGACAHCTNAQLLDKEGNPADMVVWEGHNPLTGRWYANYDRAIRWVDDRIVRLQIAIDITDRKRAEEALRESERAARALLNATTDGALLSDAAGVVREVNEQMAGRFGILPKDLIGQRMRDLLPPDLAAARRLRINEAMETGQPVRFEDQRDKIWLENSVYPILNEEDMVEGVAVYSRDITERKQAEEALRESEERYRSFVQNFQGIAYRGNMDWTAVFFHGAVEEITGYPEDVFIAGKPRWDQVVHPDDLPYVYEVGQKVATIPGYATERSYRILRKDGDVRWVHEVIQNICDDSGKPVMVQGAIYDITERKQAEEALRESEKNFRLLAENSPDIIYILDLAQGKATYFNREEFLGYTYDDITGQNSLLAQVHPEDMDATLEHWQQLTGGELGQSTAIEYRLRNKKGEWEWIESRETILLHDAQGKPSRILFNLTVITERKRAEEELAQHREHLEELVAEQTTELRAAYERLQELDQIKDDFVANVSHELRTPIANLRLYHHLLTERPEKQPAYLVTLQRETARLEHIVEDLLYLSRLDQGEITPDLSSVDLNSLVAVHISDRTALAEEKGLTLTLEQAPELPAVRADRLLFERALSILLTNAFNYTPEGGQVTVATQTRQEEGISWAGVSVSDTGPGISSDDLPNLFKRFYRGEMARLARVPGTGLGLAIAKEIIDRHGGQIEADSRGIPGKGATFTVWLPAAEK